MKRGLIAIAVMLLCGMGLMAQHDHGTTAIRVVDGRQHPELIPENVAYFNFLRERSIPSQATDEERQQQTLQLGMLGLSGQDGLQLRLELAHFRTAFEAFDASYSKQAEKGLVREDAFWGGVASLVAQTRASLNKNLSSNGHKQFEAGVQELRRHTIYYTGGAL